MTEREIADYVAELEGRWRLRTPATRIDEVLPDTRVGRSEMRAWFSARFGRNITLFEELDLQPAITKLFKGLRREFPNERWDK